MIPGLDGFASRALAALCNGLYQGVLLTLVVALALKGLRRANAATRYVLELAALAVVASLPVLHFLTAHRRTPAPPAPVITTTSTAIQPQKANARWPELRAMPMANPVADRPSEELPRTLARSQPEHSPVTPARPAANRSPAVPPRIKTPVSTPEVAELAGSNQDRSLAGQPPEPRPARSPFVGGHWQLSVPRVATLGLLGGWVTFAAWRLAGLLWQYGALWRLRRRSAAVHPPLAEMFGALRHEIRLRRRVDFRLSSELAAPIAAGFRPPAILLPCELAAAPTADLDRILRHELAHIRRWDDWTNLLQQLVQAVLAFHPAVCWLSRRLTVDREIACDDHVLAATRSPRDYALFLTDFAGRRRGRHWAAAPAAWSRNSQLKERIRMLLDSNRNTLPSPSRTRAGVLGVTWAMLAALGLYSGPRLAFSAQTPTDPLNSPEAKLKDATVPAVQPAIEVSVSTVVEPDPTPAPVARPRPVRSVPAITLPQPAVPAVPAVVATPPALVAVPAAGLPHRLIALAGSPPARTEPAPGVQPPPPAKERSADSVEARLDRLERQLQALLGRSKDAGGGDPFTAKPKDAYRLKEEAKRIEKERRDELPGYPPGVAVHGSDGVRPKVESHYADDVKAQVARVLEDVAGQVERATKEAERAVIEARRTAQLEQLKLRTAQAGKALSLDQHRRALEAERQALQRRIEDIQRQLGRLEEQLDRVDEQFDRVDEEMDRIEEEAEAHEQELETEHDHDHEGAADRKAAEPTPPIEKAPEAK